MDSRALGLVLVVIGLLVVAFGALVAVGGLGWFGRLPGDLRIERENVRIYVPLVSMLLLSLVLSLALVLLRRWF